MLYLAQVSHHPLTRQPQLKLLAQQHSEHTWGVLAQPQFVSVLDAIVPSGVALVLVELSQAQDVLSLQDATPWLLQVIDGYLGSGVSPEFLRSEAERAEQWRQSLTLQSQELGKRTLELESRMVQIQELEERLKEQKLALELAGEPKGYSGRGKEAPE